MLHTMGSWKIQKYIGKLFTLFHAGATVRICSHLYIMFFIQEGYGKQVHRIDDQFNLIFFEGNHDNCAAGRVSYSVPRAQTFA